MDNKQGDAIWFLLKTLSPALGMVPTWAVYNSLIGQKKTTDKCSDVANRKWESKRMEKPLRIYQGD